MEDLEYEIGKAIWTNDFERLEEALEEYDSRYPNLKPLLVQAADNSRLDIVQYLVSKGASPYTDYYEVEDTTVGEAADNSRLDIAKYLVSIGSDRYPDNFSSSEEARASSVCVIL